MKLVITVFLFALGLNAQALPANISASGLIHFDSDGGQLPVSVSLTLTKESSEKAKYEGKISFLENGQVQSQHLILKINKSDSSATASTENYDLQGQISESALTLSFRQTVERERCMTKRGSDGVREVICDSRLIVIDHGQLNLTFQ